MKQIVEESVGRRKEIDFVLPGGCSACEGDLAVRLSPVGARSCCLVCGWISAPRLSTEKGEIRILHSPVASA